MDHLHNNKTKDSIVYLNANKLPEQHDMLRNLYAQLENCAWKKDDSNDTAFNDDRKQRLLVLIATHEPQGEEHGTSINVEKTPELRLYRQMRDYIHRLIYDEYEKKLINCKEKIGHYSQYRQMYRLTHANSNLIEGVGSIGNFSDTTKMYNQQMSQRTADPLRCLVVIENYSVVTKRYIRDCRHLIPAYRNLFKKSGEGHLRLNEVVLVMNSEGGDFFGHVSTHWTSEMAGWNAYVDSLKGLSYGFRYQNSMVIGANEYRGDRKHPLQQLAQYVPAEMPTMNDFKWGFKMTLPGIGIVMSHVAILGRYDEHNGAQIGWQNNASVIDVSSNRLAMLKSKMNVTDMLKIIKEKKLTQNREESIRKFLEENSAYIQGERQQKSLPVIDNKYCKS